MAGGYSRSPVPRSLTSALERLMVSSESMMKWTRSSCSTHSCKLGGRSMGVSRSMFTNRVATYSQRTGGLIYSPKVRQAPGEPRSATSRGPGHVTNNFCLFALSFLLWQTMAVLFSIESDLRYQIVRKIFEGGMGIVYEAEQLGTRNFVKRVAIKVIRQNCATQKQFIDNFIGEARLVADLIHTNIVQTYHLGEAKGVYYIAMELIRGANLEQFSDQLVEKKQTLPVEIAVFIASRIVRGLAYAHAKTDKDGKPLGLVHRDVSFKNIMIAFEGDVKLTDFGIAKARGFLVDNEGEVVAGKADFMSPEQANFQITDK